MSNKSAWMAAACGGHAQDAAKACVEQLDGITGEAELAIVFISGRFAELADEIVSILQSRLRLKYVFGGCGEGIIAGSSDLGEEGGLAVLVLDISEHDFSLQRRLPGAHVGFPESCADEVTLWLAQAPEHGQATVLNDVGHLGLGGICSGGGEMPLILKQPLAGGAIGLALKNSLKFLAGMSRGTRDLGPWRRITSSVGGCIFELDHQPAGALIEADTGELLARQPDRLISQVIVETGEGKQANILMPKLALIESFERHSGRLRIREHRPGQYMRLVYRQAAPAKAELIELIRVLDSAADGKEIIAALLFSSVMRGEKLFGPGHQEPEILASELTGVPILGLRTQDELYQGQLTCGAAVLVLLTKENKANA